MVYIWYPADASQHGVQDGYVPGAKSIDADPAAKAAAEDIFGSRWPSMVAGQLQSHVIADARPAHDSKRFPVVLFSHGISASGFSYTAQIEDLVSHGYVVVSIDHTDAAGVVLFPNGTIRLQREAPAPSPPPKDSLEAMILGAETAAQTGADDVRFVLNSLQAGELPLTSMMDLQRVAAIGHSYGGTLSARACQQDSRIKACVDQDGEMNPVGAYFDYPDHASFTQPLMLIEVEWEPSDELLARMHESRSKFDAYRAHEQEQLKACSAGSYHVLLNRPGMIHPSFSDGPMLNATQGSPGFKTANENLFLIESLQRAFLDKILKGQPAPLLDLTSKTPSGVNIEHIGHSLQS